MGPLHTIGSLAPQPRTSFDSPVASASHRAQGPERLVSIGMRELDDVRQVARAAHCAGQGASTPLDLSGERPATATGTAHARNSGVYRVAPNAVHSARVPRSQSERASPAHPPAQSRPPTLAPACCWRLVACCP